MSTCYLYRFFGVDNQLLYVGIANDPARRLRQHIKNGACDGLIARVELMCFVSRDAARAAETEAIHVERPIYNNQHAPRLGTAGSAIAAMRAAMELSHHDLASLAGVDEADLRQFESGRTPEPATGWVKSVTDALGKNLSGAA